MSSFSRWAWRRLVLAVPTLVLMTVITFAVAHFAPGDPWQLGGESGPLAAPVARESVPLALQYARWVAHVVRLDFGASIIDRQPVGAKLAEAMPRSMALVGLALVLSWALALPLGLELARQRQRRWARLVSSLLAVGWALPSFWVAMMALTFSGARWGWFPLQGLGGPSALDVAWHLVLPVGCLMVPLTAAAARQVREALSQTLSTDFVKAARARGVPERAVLWGHAMRAAAAPLLTAFGLQLPNLVSGGVMIEQIFGIPGMGRLAFEAMLRRDYPVVMGAATVAALSVVVAGALVDVLAARLDPRVSR